MFIFSYEINMYFLFFFENNQIREDEERILQEDYLYNYYWVKFVFGLVLFEFDDAIKEGDGGRLYDFYKFILLMYKIYKKIKYVYVVLLYLVKFEVILLEEEVYDFKWN